MQLKDLQLFEATFIEEGKNRFICIVNLEGKLIECYVPSSSKLKQYINLEKKTVLISKNANQNARTKYALFAVKYYGKYILLNLNLVNKILGKYLVSNHEVCISYEKTINGYKTDLITNHINTKALTIIEAKGIITTKREEMFPSKYSERAIKQLKQIKKLLIDGYKVDYYIISLSPILKNLYYDISHDEFYQLFMDCIANGLNVKALAVVYENKEFKIKKLKPPCLNF